MNVSQYFRFTSLRAFLRTETLAFWALLLTLPGCTTEAEIVLPAVPPKLVVSGFISPENPVIEISVTKSASLLSNEKNDRITIVPDAEVWLSNGSDSVLIPFDGDKLYTIRNFAIMPGETYTLRAFAPSGFAVKAQCTVPVKINTSLTARIDSTEVGPQNPDGFYRLESKWQDLPGEGDFYRTHAVEATGTAGSPVITSRETITFLDEPQVKDQDHDGRTWQIASDALFDFREVRSRGTLKFYDVYLFTTDRAYYEYHNSLYHYRINNSFTDPMKLYSNVQGGLGIFAAYRMHTIQIPIQ